MREAFTSCFGEDSWRRRVEFKTDCFANPASFMEDMMRVEPSISHCSCHGDLRGLWLSGSQSLVESGCIVDALAAYNKEVESGCRIQLVIVNSCMSGPPASALSGCGDFVIGHGKREVTCQKKSCSDCSRKSLPARTLSLPHTMTMDRSCSRQQIRNTTISTAATCPVPTPIREDRSSVVLATRNTGERDDFQQQMEGFIHHFLTNSRLEDVDTEWATYDVALGDGASNKWTLCMLLWVEFAAKAFDPSLRDKWRKTCNNAPSQETLLSTFNQCLLDPATSPKLWGGDDFKTSACGKQYGACLFFTLRH